MRSFLCLLVPLLALARPYPTNVGTPSPAIGNGGTFSFGFRPDGTTKRPISTVYMAIESSPGADGCYFSYWPQWGIFLADRTGNAVGPLAPGSSGSLENASCRLSGAGSYATFGVDGELSVGLSVTFKAAMPAGTKPLWSAALDGVDNSGWVQNLGEIYCVRACTATNLVPVVAPLTPEQRTGAVERFTFDFSDGNGASDISNALVLINGGLDSRDACLLSIDPLADFGKGVAYFVTDRGPGQVVTVDTLFPGNTATVGRNEQCEVQGGSLSIIKFSTTVRVSMSITMKGAGTKQIYMAALDQRGGNSTWVARGAWSAPIPSAATLGVNPGCGNATACIDYFGFNLATADPADLKLAIGPILLKNVYPNEVRLNYSNISLQLRRYSTTECSGHQPGFPGRSTGSVVRTITPDSRWSTVSPNDLSVGIVDKGSGAMGSVVARVADFGPGAYYYRLSGSLSVIGLVPWKPNFTVPDWSIDSGCVSAGWAPQITGIRDDTTGQEDQIERGTARSTLQIWGNNLNGVPLGPYGSSLNPVQGVSDWWVLGVYPAVGQVNLR